jgi:uncharacterized protein YqhQ
MSAEKEIIVGGQAVIEGVMMRTPNAYAIAVRQKNGAIVNMSGTLPKWSDTYPALRAPVLRGAAVLIQSMSLGIKALNYSANVAFAEEEEAAAVAVALKPATVEGEGGFTGMAGGVTAVVRAQQRRPNQTASAAGSIIFALVFNILLFIVAPLLLTNAIFIAAGWAAAPTATLATANGVSHAGPTAVEPGAAVSETWQARATRTIRLYLHPVRPSVGFNLIDGLIRTAFFLIMIFSFSLFKDIRRVFEYHGAEHKTVFTWEAGLPLTVENARCQPRQHPRCGTSFLMVVMLVSIAVFSLIKFDSLILNLASRIALMPVIAGLSYEVIRLSARKEGSIIFKLMTRPGVWLQKITTQEPNDEQLEVAIHALKESLKLEPGAAVVSNQPSAAGA